MISNFHAIIFEHHQIFQEVTAAHMKKGYSLVNANCLQSTQACRYVVQDCSNKSNLRIGISFHTPKSNFELAKRKSFVRTYSSNFNPRGLFKIAFVHFASDGFERTLHLLPRSKLQVQVSQSISSLCQFVSFLRLAEQPRS